MFQELRGTGYQGPIVVLTYYSLTYTDPAQLQTAGFLDSVLENAASLNGGIVADGFTRSPARLPRSAATRVRPGC